MKLSLEEAAARLGKSVRQIRYMVKLGRLQASKVAGRWFVELADIPKTEGQAAAAARKGRRLRDLIDDALDVDPEQRRYSVRDLRAFQIGLPLYRAAHATAEAHQATAALRRMLEHLARGCHRFDCAAKLDAYRAARDEASLAVCELILQPVEDADRLISAIEQDLLAALAGALRRVERQGQRRPGGRDRDPP